MAAVVRLFTRQRRRQLQPLVRHRERQLKRAHQILRRSSSPLIHFIPISISEIEFPKRIESMNLIHQFRPTFVFVFIGKLMPYKKNINN